MEGLRETLHADAASGQARETRARMATPLGPERGPSPAAVHARLDFKLRDRDTLCETRGGIFARDTVIGLDWIVYWARSDIRDGIER